LINFFLATKNYKSVPMIVGILPLVSYKNAEFLHNEVPGMQIPESIMRRMALAKTKDEQKNEGIRIAREALEYVKTIERVKGVYIFPPFGRYELVFDVIE